jgi:hypothetical protein
MKAKPTVKNTPSRKSRILQLYAETGSLEECVAYGRRLKLADGSVRSWCNAARRQAVAEKAARTQARAEKKRATKVKRQAEGKQEQGQKVTAPPGGGGMAITACA